MGVVGSESILTIHEVLPRLNFNLIDYKLNTDIPLTKKGDFVPNILYVTIQNHAKYFSE